MKKNILFYVIIVLFIFNVKSFSQLRIGAHLGFNLADADYTNNSYSNTKVESKIGFIAGGLLELKISDKLFIQPEFNYIQKGTDLTPLPGLLYGVAAGPYIVPDPDSREKVTLDFFEIPLLLKMKFGENKLKPYAFLGPSLGFAITETEEFTFSIDPTWNSTHHHIDSIKNDFGFILGGGVEYDLNEKMSLFANLRYSLGLSDISKFVNQSYKTRGLELLVGINYCFILCDKEIYTIEEKKPVPSTTKEHTIVKEYDLGKYNIPFFISGYYRPNTQKNLDEMIELTNGKLKNATYIEKIAPNSSKYEQNKLYAQSVENIFKTIYVNSVDEIFPLFYSKAQPNEYFEIAIYGYADPRPLTGKYWDDDDVIFEDIKGTSYTIVKGDDLNNLKLSGLRAWYTGKYLDELLANAASQGKTEYTELKKNGKIIYKYIGAEVAQDEDKLEAQRRIKITFTKYEE
jgi:opacity protein-like surface antigen